MSLPYAIIPYGEEFCVAHLGLARIPGTDKFKECWVVDQVCPNVGAAVTAQLIFVKAARVRAKQTEADMRALGLRR